MDDDGVLRSLQQRTNIGRCVFFAGWMLLILAGPLGWNRQTVTDYGEGTQCVVDGRPVDCATTYIPAGILPPPTTHVIFNPAPYGFGLLLMIAGILALGAARGNWNILKQEMVDYAYRRAEHEGKTPDLGFLHFFDSWYRGATEWEILRRSYAEMQNWSPEPALRYGPVDRPYQMQTEDSQEQRCGGCGAARRTEDRFCSRCGAAFSA
ncbi:hypothetical protein CCAX7_003250 [Capsulimonas corticalis]|uniref:Uncharacterized protein n=1 Tax=Capsulimonas corticalis TaxID=2219043 RepID=A0A402CS62_9BACT|nr:hypothetical protein [Capsulimonas corticalis]BDI28274.1 hypothetical protein CCAX7_003250 [Capsulimonas corticalis]